MSRSLLGYKAVETGTRAKGVVESSAVDTASGEKVILWEVDWQEACGGREPLLMTFLVSHVLNQSPYVMKVLKCFQDSEKLYVVLRHMDLGPIPRVVGKGTASDDFVLYVFMQVVYAMRANERETWFWERMGTDSIWIDSDGKVRICWADVVVGGMDDVAKDVRLWAVEGLRPGSCGAAGDVASKCLVSLRRIFTGLVGVSGGVDEESCEWTASGAGGRRGLSPVLDEFASILFGDGECVEDLERYVRGLIRERRIASNPRQILESLCGASGNRSGCGGALEGMGGSGRASPRTEEAESGSGSEESSRNAGDEERGTVFGTREYKRGRFHVCEAIPLGERERSLQMGEQIKKVVRAVAVQSRQIGVLASVFKQQGLLDKEAEAELASLEDALGALLAGIEKP